MTDDEQKQQQDLIQAIQRTFSSADGKKTLAWLERISGYSLPQPPGPEHKMAYYLGGRQVYVLICEQLARNPHEEKQKRATTMHRETEDGPYG